MLSRGLPTVLTAALLLMPMTVAAQKPAKKTAANPVTAVAAAAANPKLAGIWEPVSYPADIEFVDVYFVTPQVGWVSGYSRSDAGEGGVLLHTKDGGTTWTIQLGDPESATRGFSVMQFIDARHGWVTEYGGKILRTTDGENWETMGNWSYGAPFRFISHETGFGVWGPTISRTDDGGRSWKPIYQCQLKIQVEGLTKAEACHLEALHFPTSRVGFALSRQLANGASAILKTEDGGASWNPLSFLPDASGKEGAIHFFNETKGLIRTYHQIFLTSDGGQTWRSVPATVPGGSPAVRFADPEVGWIVKGNVVTYTADGGKRWNSRETAFPAPVSGFSLPRRDRGYVVGSHGMIYRYRLVPTAEARAPKLIAAPAMPVFDSPLDERVTELDAAVDALEASVASAPESVPGGKGAPAAAATEDAGDEAESEASEDGTEIEEVGGDASQASAFTAACCTKPLSKFDLALTAVTGLIPQFLGQYKNTNLLLAGLQMLTDLPGRVNDLNRAMRSFRKAPNKAAAQASLAQVAAAIQGLSHSTEIAFQKKLPPATEESGEAGAPAVAETPAAELETAAPENDEMAPPEGVITPAAEDGAPPAEDVEEVEEASEDSVAADAASAAEQEAKKKAKESAEKALKKKLRF